MAIDVLQFFAFILMVWEGTSFEVLFKKRNLIIFTVLSFLTVSMTVFSIMWGRLLQQGRGQANISRYYAFYKTDVLLVNLLNFLNTFIIQARFLYLGVVKRGLDNDSEEVLNEQLALE